MVDARLADGSRVNAIIPPVSIDGPALTIRKFSKHAFDLDDLISLGTLTPSLATFLMSCVEGRLNILVSGGTGTGKTTLLNVLSSMIPDDERIVTIEDAAELQLKQRHIVRLEGRPPNIEGRGEVTARDLVRNALRMRPDRIIVGEVRSGEALDMLQAMNTGHDGSISTSTPTPRRARSPDSRRWCSWRGSISPCAVREQSASAIDLLVHLSRLRDGTRRITQICEVNMEGDVITLSDLFTFDYAAGIDDEGRFAGSIRPTGLRPTSPTGSTTTASSSRPSCSTWNGCGSSAPPPRPARAAPGGSRRPSRRWHHEDAHRGGVRVLRRLPRDPPAAVRVRRRQHATPRRRRGRRRPRPSPHHRDRATPALRESSSTPTTSPSRKPASVASRA